MANTNNAGALREALADERDWLIRQNSQRLDALATSEFVCSAHTYQRIGRELIEDNRYHISKIDAALAKPPRNCDVGTAEEQKDRFHNFCLSHSVYIDEFHEEKCNPECPIAKLFEQTPHYCDNCQLVWAQMPYEADEAKGGEA